MNIDPAWTDAGKQAARRCGTELADVVAILDSPTAIQLIGPDSIWFVDVVGDDAVTVIVDRQARNTAIYEITLVRWAGPQEIKMWRLKQR